MDWTPEKLKAVNDYVPPSAEEIAKMPKHIRKVSKQRADGPILGISHLIGGKRDMYHQSGIKEVAVSVVYVQKLMQLQVLLQSRISLKLWDCQYKQLSTVITET
jgi:hypothetical protein